MKTNLGKVDGELWEYQLVAQLDEEVMRKVTEVKKTLFEECNLKNPFENKSHITVARFLATESMEQTVIRWIERVFSQRKSFNVTLNNYGGFPPPEIYLRIQDHEPFERLAKELSVIDDYVRSSGYPPVRLIKRPHLQLATDIDSRLYERLMLDYSQRTFHETFLVTEFVLLKRAHEFSDCDPVNVFRLYPPDTHNCNRVA